VKQTDHGITPVSVGGVVSLKNSVNVSFAIVGAERSRRSRAEAATPPSLWRTPSGRLGVDPVMTSC
jgi:hypothetical protein